jgi:hypothetical protein
VRRVMATALSSQRMAVPQVSLAAADRDALRSSAES